MLPTRHGPTFTETVDALRPLFGEMLLIRKVRGVRLKDGRQMYASDRQTFVMYDVGIQEEDDNGATLWNWDEVKEVII
jgi:hypothetical protein